MFETIVSDVTLRADVLTVILLFWITIAAIMLWDTLWRHKNER